MEDIFYIIFNVLLLFAIIAFSKWYKYEKNQKLRELISWAAIGNYCPALGRYSYVNELIFYVLNAQHNNGIDQKYKITTDDEKTFVREILEYYQIEIMRSYFKKESIVIKSKYCVSNSDYFMFTLYVFLSDHQWDSNFTCKKTKEFENVLHKMHYITYMYCKNSQILMHYVPSWNEKVLKEILDELPI